MRVLMINGSPHAEGCTYTALREVAKTLEEQGVETTLLQIGKKPVQGCIACGSCGETRRCFYDDDLCNRAIEQMRDCDGLVVGSPVYFAAPNGALCALLDRIFYAGDKANTANKPAAAVVSCRRAGSSAALDRLYKYFTISNMPVVSSQYWAQVHGFTPEDVRQDEEGMQTMRQIGRNMAWLLHSIKEGQRDLPERESRLWTNFIR